MIAIARGDRSDLDRLAGVSVAVVIGVTVQPGEPHVGDVGGLPVRGDCDRLGPLPTLIGLPAVLVAVVIGVTVPDSKLAT